MAKRLKPHEREGVTMKAGKRDGLPSFKINTNGTRKHLSLIWMFGQSCGYRKLAVLPVSKEKRYEIRISRQYSRHLATSTMGSVP